MVEEGKLSWTKTLEQVFPDLASKMNPAYRKVTLEQMLSHRAGLSADPWPKGKTFGDMHGLPGTPRELRAAYPAMVLSEPPAAEPGSKYLYSNRSYVVAGAIAEKVANDSWESQMQHRIFGPLGMRTCGFGAMGTPGKSDEPWQHTLILTIAPSSPDRSPTTHSSSAPPAQCTVP